MAKRHTKHEEPTARIERWYNRADAATFLGVTVEQLKDWAVQKKGPRFKKFGQNIQSPVAYPESWLIEFQNNVRTIETEHYEAEKAS